MNIKLGITGRLAVAFILLAAISQALNYYSSRDLREASIKKGELEKINSISRIIVPEIKNEMDQIKLVARLLPLHGGFLSGMRQEGAQRREAVSKIADTLYKESKVDLLEVTDASGVVIYRAQDPGRSGDVSMVWGVDEALAGKGNTVSTKIPGGAMIIHVAPLRVDEEIVGTVLAGTEIGEKFMSNLASEVGAELALLNRSGDLVASSSSGRLHPDSSAVMDAFLQKIPIYHSNDVEHISQVYLPILIIDEAWVIMTEIDSTSASSLLEKGDRQSLIFTLFVVAGLVLTTFLILRYSLRPLHSLRLRAEREVAKLLGMARAGHAGDEISSVVQVFETLTDLLEKRNRELSEEKSKLEREVNRSQTAAAEINKLAYYDTLTNLPNRRLLFDLLEKELAACSHHQRIGALLFIDLDDFKTLNDTLGHDKGDRLLEFTARRLSACVREDDIVARLGGDEFVVMLKGLSLDPLTAADKAGKMGKKILATLNHTFQISGHEYHCSASIGITLFADSLGTIEDLLMQADMAMYQAKASGHNMMEFFHPEMQARITERAALEADLREGIQKDQFYLCYQGQVSNDLRLTGAEVLVRWRHPRRGLVPPAEFIPVAEETGLILPLGKKILETACAQLAQWSTRPDMRELTLAVNISARQFQQPDFVDQVLGILERTGADARLLKLELTETLVLHNIEEVIAKMTELKNHGIGFSLDDFGTGYSSLSYLKMMPLDQLKIDRAFIRDIATNPHDAAIAKIVINLANTLGLTVIAEGVENKRQKDSLTRMGCNLYQGFFFSVPLPLDDFEDFVRLNGLGGAPRSPFEDTPLFQLEPAPRSGFRGPQMARAGSADEPDFTASAMA